MNSDQIRPETAWEVADLLGYAYVIVSDVMEELLRPTGLTLKEFVALWIASVYEGNLTQTEWGRLQGVTRQRAHVIAGNLKRKSLISMEAKGRETRVTVTPAGRKLIQNHRRKISESLANSLGKMTQSEAVKLTTLLKQVISIVSTS